MQYQNIFCCQFFCVYGIVVKILQSPLHPTVKRKKFILTLTAWNDSEIGLNATLGF